MSENREEILADFQACTGIDDVAKAIYLLEETNWDLLSAVNKVLPQDPQSFQANPVIDVDMTPEVIEIPSSPVETATDMLSVGNNVGTSRSMASMANMPNMPNMPSLLETAHLGQNAMPSTSAASNGARMIKFNVQYCDRIISIEVPDTGTVADIKKMLHKQLKVAPCRQLLSGWARMAQFQNTPLSELSLPPVNVLHLSVISADLSQDDNEVVEKLKSNYILKIKDENTDKTYSLHYPGTKVILDVKTDIYTLTNVHVRNQIWSGWPPSIDDTIMLALSGINYPEHELTLRQSTTPAGPPVRERKPKNNDVGNIDSDDEEYEDAIESFNVEDDCFMDQVSVKRPEPLIPQHVEDEIVGSISFSEQFTNRYGHIHPNFYQGTLEDAVREACNKPAKDRKLLGIYLHHDSSVLSNVFCTELLGFESVMQLMERNFVLWGWDLTFETNRTRLQASLLNCLGPIAASSLKNIPVDKLPAIFIIMKIRSTTEIYNIVYGNVGVNELLSSLVESVEVFTEHQKVEVKEEQERAERELVKWEQDIAFNESLEADRAKEEAKRALAEAESKEKLRVESEKARELERREAHRLEVASSLPEEPPLGTDNITKIRFRLPTGENLERRFLSTTALKVLLDYCIVKGFPTAEYKVISSWPRRDLTVIDTSKTLQELNLCPQETVILEER